ncbi:hypothetical protein SOCEGT47_032400 [Sorangium cellulosum]|uniref:Uncharacterized protein n=1 Tax=Sorangium cellulosum TaxID=56 RepID=A0A4P2Q1K7_SORCE|nr:hypothetical protein [Sorangium cellulosum]AUX22733.1 hypothetical protein SOCEGT47_032400 [Sorangium cellulosum]
MQRDDHRRAALRALQDGLRELERNEERRAAHRAIRAGWLRYMGPRYGNDICSMCGAPLERGTAYMHCAPCLATRGIDEQALRRACAAAMAGDWPFQERRLDERRWAYGLIAFWRDHVDPVESRAVPYRNNTLESAFYFMKQRLCEAGVAEVWTVPDESQRGLDPAMVVRARGEALAIGVATQRRIATAGEGLRSAHVSMFDEFLRLAGEQGGFLVVEKLSRRARRDAPVKEIPVITAGGRRVTQLRCMQEDRGWPADPLA